MEAAQHYKDSTQPLRNALKRSERKSTSHSRRHSTRRTYLSSSCSDSGSSCCSHFDSSDPESDRASGSHGGHRHHHHHHARSAKAEKEKAVVKVKVKKDNSKEIIKKMAEELTAIKVNLAENRLLLFHP